jgi:hypothetical protein
MPPNTSDSRHKVLMASSCGCCFFSAIFSGRMWMIRNMPMQTTGAMINATHATPLATASSVSPENSEACAAGAAASERSAAVAIHGVRGCVAWRREVFVDILAPGDRRRVVST